MPERDLGDEMVRYMLRLRVSGSSDIKIGREVRMPMDRLWLVLDGHARMLAAEAARPQVGRPPVLSLSMELQIREWCVSSTTKATKIEAVRRLALIGITVSLETVGRTLKSTLLKGEEAVERADRRHSFYWQSVWPFQRGMTNDLLRC